MGKPWCKSNAIFGTNDWANPIITQPASVKLPRKTQYPVPSNQYPVRISSAANVYDTLDKPPKPEKSTAMNRVPESRQVSAGLHH